MVRTAIPRRPQSFLSSGDEAVWREIRCSERCRHCRGDRRRETAEFGTLVGGSASSHSSLAIFLRRRRPPPLGVRILLLFLQCVRVGLKRGSPPLPSTIKSHCSEENTEIDTLDPLRKRECCAAVARRADWHTAELGIARAGGWRLIAYRDHIGPDRERPFPSGRSGARRLRHRAAPRARALAERRKRVGARNKRV